MKKTHSWLLSLFAFFFFYVMSYSETYQGGNFRLETTSSNGNINIYHNDGVNDVRIINDSKSVFRINTRSGNYINTIANTDYTVSSIISESSEAISDNFGSGIKVTLVCGSSALGVTVTQYFYLYDGLDYLLTEITLSSENDLLSNYIAPIKTTSGNTTALPGASSGNVNRVLEIPFHNDAFVKYGSQNFATTTITTTRNSYEVGGVYHEASRKGLIVGSVEHTTWKTGIVIGTRSRNNIYTMEVYGGRAQTLNSSLTSTQIHGTVKGKTIKSPKIFVGYFDDWRTGMETFGDVNAIVAPKYEWHGQKPFGWSSWGQIKDALDYYNLMGSAKWIHENIQDPNHDKEPQPNEFQNEGKTLISLDSFWDWQMNYNHWRTIPAILAKNNQRAGMYGGAYVHWSETGTDRVGNTGYTYDDIYLRYNGNPQRYDGARALDPTHPGTKAIVENQLNNFLMWGYKYIKLDFVGHAALEADSWYDPNVTTGIQAYNYALNHVTTYLKNHPLYPKDEEVFLNLSIAPLFPANYAHGRRISCDAWGEFGTATSTGTTRYMLNSLTYGWWLDRVYSYNDADHAALLGRGSGEANSSSNATLNENRSRITSSAITGIFLLGDNYSSAEDYPAGHPAGNVKVGNSTSKQRTPELTTNAEVNEMVRRTKSFRPVYSGDAGQYNTEQYTTKIGDITYVAVFNNGNSGNKTMSFADLGLSGNYTVHELWGDAKADRSATWTENVGTHDVKLFKIYPAGHSGELPLIEQKTMPAYRPQPSQVTNAIATTHTSAAPAPNWKVIKDWTNGLPWTTGGRLIWGDYNNDGYLDAFFFANEMKLYKNNGDDTFSEIPDPQILSLRNGSAIFVDYNNDGYLDLITTGNQEDKGLDNRAYIFAYKNTGYPDYTFEMDVINSANLIPGNTENGDGVGRMFEAVDFDHDGWMDLIHTGHPSDGGATNDGAWRITTLYRNNQGIFQRDRTAVNGADFDRVSAGSIHVGDVNGDGYADIVNVGYGEDVGGYAGRLYINTGNGTFTKSSYSSSLSGNEQCEVIFADINGDGYGDIVEISGGYANLHINKNDGSFTKYLPAQTGLVSRGGTSITAGDVNNDGNLDLFVCGHGGGISTIYYNTGSLTFIPVDVPDATKARSGNSNLVDINRDGNLDFSTYGYGVDWSSNFVLNDLGNGIIQNTAPAVPANFKVSYQSGKYILTWAKSTDDITPQPAIRYNVFAKEKSTGNTYFYAPADIATGRLKIGGGIVPLIATNSFEWNLPEADYEFGVQAVDQADVASSFATVFQEWEVIATRDNGLPHDSGTQPVGGRMIWGDYNNDGHKDIFIIGGLYDATVQLWRNNGDNTFTREQSDAFLALRQSSAVFIDYDNDGDLDLVTTGRYYENGSEDRGNKIFVYENTGTANGYAYVKNDDRSNELDSRLNMNIGDGNSVGRILQVLDYNNDGWLDLIACGATNYNVWGWNPTKDDTGGWDWLSWSGTVVAKNNQGSFEIDWGIVENGGEGTIMDYFREGSVHTGDVNGDGYVDVLVQGYGGDYGLGWGARLYINNKNGKFTLSPYSSELNGNQAYETVFVDINNDGYDDLVEISKSVANVHINDKEGGFTKIDITTNGLIRAVSVSITAGDINNDGWVDLLVSGMDGEDGHDGPQALNTTKIFYNNGDNTFTAVDVLDNMRARTGSVALVDVNNDGNLDFSNFGWWGTTVAINRLGTTQNNTTPTVPANLTVSYADDKFFLSWNASSDVETPVAALRYNVYARNIDTNVVYAYAPVDLATGKLKIGGEIVPLIHGTSFEWNLPEANYEFGVQAIDQADLNSAFTTKTYAASAPVEVVALSPEDGAVEVAIDAIVAVTFNVPVEGSLAGITINGETAEASIEGAVLTIAHSDFENDAEYLVTIPAGAITDYAEAITWSFATKAITGIDNVETGKIYVADQTLYVTGYPATASIVVYNVLGQVVVNAEVTTEGIPLHPGSYVANIQVEGKIYTHKVLVK